MKKNQLIEQFIENLSNSEDRELYVFDHDKTVSFRASTSKQNHYITVSVKESEYKIQLIYKDVLKLGDRIEFELTKAEFVVLKNGVINEL